MRKTLPPGRSPTVIRQGLTEREILFAREYVARGGRGSGADAAQAAGYSPHNRNAARVRASELLRRDDILKFIHDELVRELDAGAALGVATLKELAQNARSEQVRLSAAAQLIDRSSLGPPISRSAHLHQHQGKTIEDFLRELDQEEQRELQNAGNQLVVDAEFSEVAAPPKPQGPDSPYGAPWRDDEASD